MGRVFYPARRRFLMVWWSARLSSWRVVRQRLVLTPHCCVAALLLTAFYVFLGIITLKVLTGRSNYEEVSYINADGDAVLDPASPRETCHTAAHEQPLPRGINQVFVSSAPNNHVRRQVLSKNLRRHGIEQFQLRQDWDLTRVKRALGTEQLQWIFTGAIGAMHPESIPRHKGSSSDFE